MHLQLGFLEKFRASDFHPNAITGYSDDGPAITVLLSELLEVCPVGGEHENSRSRRLNAFA